jgi:hypothetical protein
MLPFLKPKQAGSVVSVKYGEGKQESEGVEGEHSPGHMAAAEDLISAVHAKDAKGVADALKAHHELMESQEDFLSSDEGA